MIYLTLMEHSAMLQNNTCLILTYLKTCFVLTYIIKVMLWQLCREGFYIYMFLLVLVALYPSWKLYAKNAKKIEISHQVETYPSTKKSLGLCVTGTEVRDRSENGDKIIKHDNCIGYAGDYWCFNNLYLVYQRRCTAELRLICFVLWKLQNHASVFLTEIRTVPNVLLLLWNNVLKKADWQPS